MPTFDLSLVKKPKIKRKDSFNKTKGKHTVIQRNVKGVCCITLEGFYYVQFGEHLYKFTSESYNIVTNDYYSKQLVNGKIVHIKTLKDNNKWDGEYFPFAPGVIVKGNIVRHNTLNDYFFDLKGTYCDWKYLETTESFKFFRDNYETIRANQNNG